MTVEEVGRGALQGWRVKAADRIAPAVAKRTPLSEERVRGLLGLVFLALVIRYLVKTARDARSRFNA